MRIGTKIFEVKAPLGMRLGEAVGGLKAGRDKVIKAEAVKCAYGIPVDKLISDVLIGNIKRAYRGAIFSLKLAAPKVLESNIQIPTPENNIQMPKKLKNSIGQIFRTTNNAANKLYEENWGIFAQQFSENPIIAVRQVFRRAAKVAEIDRLKQELVEQKTPKAVKTTDDIIASAIEIKERQIAKLRQILISNPEQVRMYIEDMSDKAKVKDLSANWELLEKASQTVEAKYRIPETGARIITPEDPDYFQNAKLRRIGKRNPVVTDLELYRQKHPNAMENRKNIQIAAEYDRLVRHEEKVQEMRELIKKLHYPAVQKQETPNLFEEKRDWILGQIRNKIQQFQLEKSFLESALANLRQSKKT